MSQKMYNITDNVNDDFKFIVRDKKYSMRYPRTGEIEELQRITDELKEAEPLKQTDPEKYKEKTTEVENYMYGFITPVEHDTPIRAILENENVVVMRNFNKMIRTELSLEA